MRVVLDTNVVVSALLWNGNPERLIDAAGDGRLALFTSEALVAELATILQRAKFATRLAQLSSSPDEVVAHYRQVADLVDAPSIEEARLRDSDDAAVLACALAVRADAIVSGDDDLHALGTFQGIPVLSPAQLLQRITATS